MISCGNIFSCCWFVQVCQHFICGSIWYLRLVVFWLAAAWTSLSVRHFFMCSDATFWVLLSLFRSFSFWCFIMTGMLLTSSYLSDIRLAAYLYVTILLQGFCNSLIVLVIQMFDKSPKLLIIPFKIQCGCFGFPPFHWSCYRMAKEFDPYLQQYNGCS